MSRYNTGPDVATGASVLQSPSPPSLKSQMTFITGQRSEHGRLHADRRQDRQERLQ